MRRSMPCHPLLLWHERLLLDGKRGLRTCAQKYNKNILLKQSINCFLNSLFLFCFSCSPAASRYLTKSRWPSCAASIRGVEQPNSMSAPALMRKSATSKKPPQHARVKAVSWVSSVCALMFAPGQQKNESQEMMTAWLQEFTCKNVARSGFFKNPLSSKKRITEELMAWKESNLFRPVCSKVSFLKCKKKTFLP